jgi:hypothetical protein
MFKYKIITRNRRDIRPGIVMRMQDRLRGMGNDFGSLWTITRQVGNIFTVVPLDVRFNGESRTLNSREIMQHFEFVDHTIDVPNPINLAEIIAQLQLC